MAEIHDLNPYETEFVYREIFERRVYLQHGVRLDPGAVVLDIGANIGLFTRFVKQECPSARIFAFEPAREAYRCLLGNCEAYGDSVVALNCAVSGRSGKAAFSYYPGYSVISGLHADRAVDQSVIENGMRQSALPADEIHGLVSSRMSEVHRREVPTITLSDFFTSIGLERVSLLKIDAERSELDILDGIKPADWGKIDQIVMETHSREDRDHARNRLAWHGFKIAWMADEALSESGISTLYAVRP